MQALINDYQRRIRDLGDVYERDIFKKLKSSHRITGIIGPRGIGKTTYILHYLEKKYKNDSSALYVSADDVYFADHKLIDLAEQFINKYNGKLLCIDEIHKYPNWSQELKNIYDKYRQLKIIFSGSSSIDLIKEKYDLSRRAALRHLPGFSFREFLEMKTGKSYPILTIEQIVKNRIESFDDITKTPKLLGFFQEYLEVGYYPIFTLYTSKKEFYEALLGIVEKTIYIDIASYYQLKTSTLPVFKKMLYFIFTASPSSINVNRVAKSLKKDFSDVANYFEMMRDSGLLKFLLNDKRGHALVRKPEKIYLNNPNLMYALDDESGKQSEKGAVRELFVIFNLEHSGYNPFYSSVGDIKCGKYIFEIGGRNKDSRQIAGEKNAFLVLDDIINGDIERIPLYLFGFLY